MKAYKGFNSQLQCAPNNKIFQFEIGKTYEEKKAILCKSGFHACIDPIDVLRFYDPANSRFCEVDIEDVSEERDPDNSKICGKKITIIKEYTIIEFIELCKDYRKSNTADKSTASNTGDKSIASNTGPYSKAEITKANSIAIVSGYKSRAKGVIGSWLVLVEWDKEYENIQNIKSKKVDGEIIKENTYYQLIDGKFVEVEK